MANTIPVPSAGIAPVKTNATSVATSAPSMTNNAASGSSALGIISGLFNTLNTGLSAVYNKNQQKRAMEFQRESEERQNQYNIEAEQRSLQYQKDLIDYTNEYNDPSAQAQRYADAGFNPYLVDVDSGQMSQPASVGANAATAQSGFTPNMIDSVGLDSVPDAVLQGMQYSLEKKKLAFENDKIDLARREFARSMFESDREFLHKKSMDEAAAIFQRTARNADERFKAREISLAERKQMKAEAHEAFEEARETANDTLALQRHNLSMKIGNLQYNKDEEEYKELFPEIKRNKKLTLLYDSAKKDLSPEQLEFVSQLERKSEELRGKLLNNDISYQDYLSTMRSLWDLNTKSHWDRFDSYRYFKFGPIPMSNPYKQDDALDKVAGLASKLFGLLK